MSVYNPSQYLLLKAVNLKPGRPWEDALAWLKSLQHLGFNAPIQEAGEPVRSGAAQLTQALVVGGEEAAMVYAASGDGLRISAISLGWIACASQNFDEIIQAMDKSSRHLSAALGVPHLSLNQIDIFNPAEEGENAEAIAQLWWSRAPHVHAAPFKDLKAFQAAKSAQAGAQDAFIADFVVEKNHQGLWTLQVLLTA